MNNNKLLTITSENTEVLHAERRFFPPEIIQHFRRKHQQLILHLHRRSVALYIYSPQSNALKIMKERLVAYHINLYLLTSLLALSILCLLHFLASVILTRGPL